MPNSDIAVALAGGLTVGLILWLFGDHPAIAWINTPAAYCLGVISGLTSAYASRKWIKKFGED